MNVSVVGSGYVGTTVAACLADLGHDVVAVDIDEDVVEALNAGESPIHEPGLQPLLDAHVGRRLQATTDYDAVRDTAVTILAIQTPANEDGSINSRPLESAAEMLGEALREQDSYHLVSVKSTVLPGITEGKIIPAIEATSGKQEGVDFGVAVNPEFQREGSAVDDFMDPDKIVVGTDGDERALDLLASLYEPLVVEWDVPVVETGRGEAAMIKYANNTFLASKISLINEIGNICKEHGVDTYEVAEAIGLDERIGEQFLRSGVGWGGSCLPKDTAALMAAARDVGYEPDLLEAVITVNEKQPRRMLAILDQYVDVEGESVAVLGLSFKPDTDDVRGSRAVPIVEGLLDRGASVSAYDPIAAHSMRAEFPEIEYAETAGDALDGAVGALVVTDWEEFAHLDTEFDEMDTPVVVDGRRIIQRRDGITYEGLTW